MVRYSIILVTVYITSSLVFGNMSGVLFAAFLSYFLGFVGPFAAVGTFTHLLNFSIGIVFLFFAIFQNNFV